MRIASLLFLGLTLAAAPAVAQSFYSNGRINVNTDAWTINFGFVVSDTFTVPSSSNLATITGASFGMWFFPGDSLTSAEITITSQENGGIVYYDQVDSFVQSGCVANGYGFDVCTESSSFAGPGLNQGTYWSTCRMPA